MAPINWLCRHSFKECSDLPPLRPIFSCDACDKWRARVHSVHYKDRSSLIRSELSARYQCTRIKKGYNPIRIRIICNPEGNICENDTPERQRLTSIGHLKPSKKPKIGESNAKELADAKSRRAKLIIEKLNAVDNSNALERENLVLKMKLDSTESKLKSAQDMENENMVLKAKLDSTERKLKSAKVLANHYKKENSKKEIYQLKKTDGVLSNNIDPMKYLCKSIEKLLGTVLPGKHAHEKASLLITALSSAKLLKGEGLKVLNELKRQHIRQVFKEWRLLKAFDCSSFGAFKTSTLQAMHSVLDEENNGYFPSASSLARCRKLLDEHGKNIVGYERRITRYGEVYYINFDKAIRLLLKATGLYEKAQRTGVSLAFTADGAALMKSRTHVSCGVKITDVEGFHPVTKMPLSIPADDESDHENIFNMVQSRELCAILVMADAKDSKELYYDVFKEFYSYSEKLRQYGMEADEGEPALRPFLVTHPQDMKSSQTVSNKGGNCKMKTFFCHLCSCTKHQLVSYNIGENRCDRCQRRNREKCYHHPVCDSISTEKLLAELEEQLFGYIERYSKSYEDIAKASKLLTDPLQVNKEIDSHHIDFIIPENDVVKKREFSQFIAKECLLRKIPTNGTSVENWREALRDSVFVERRLKFLLELKEWKHGGNQSVPLMEIIELLIPCILHLENRVGEKIITMILRKGLERFPGIATHYIDELEDVIRRKVLGSTTSPSHWKLRWSRSVDGSHQIEPIQEHNSTVRCMMDSVDVLIDSAFSNADDDYKNKLKLACSKYLQAIELLTAHRILSDDEQETFQDLIDDFFQIWIDLFSTEGMTNYIHLLGSGHILFFLQKYKCLYIYSQQGWESLNSICTGYILQNSSRGGKGSGESGNKSYIYPLIRYLVRDLLWKTGEADRFFIEWESKKVRTK